VVVVVDVVLEGADVEVDVLEDDVEPRSPKDPPESPHAPATTTRAVAMANLRHMMPGPVISLLYPPAAVGSRPATQ